MGVGGFTVQHYEGLRRDRGITFQKKVCITIFGLTFLRKLPFRICVCLKSSASTMDAMVDNISSNGDLPFMSGILYYNSVFLGNIQRYTSITVDQTAPIYNIIIMFDTVLGQKGNFEHEK